MVGHLQQEASTVLPTPENFPMFGPPSLSSSTFFPDSPMRRSPENVRTISSDQLLANSPVASVTHQPPRPTVYHSTVAAQSVYVPAPNRFNTRAISQFPSPPISSASSSFTVPSLSTFSATQLSGVYQGSNGTVTHDPFLSDVTVTEDETTTTPDFNFDSADSSSVPDPTEATVLNWRFLQISGIALDVRASLGQVYQAIRDSRDESFIRPDRPIDITEVAGVQNLSELFLNALYKSNDHQHPEYQQASIVYICAIAMTFLFQPNASDPRMIREFNRHIGEIRHHLSIDPNISAQDCKSMIMDYLKLVSRYKIIYHSQYFLHGLDLWEP